jgi:hypothetical protein
MVATKQPTEVEIRLIDKLVFYARNPRKNDAAVDRMCGSIREFGFKIPVLARTDGEVVDGHLRLKAARKLGSWPGGDTSQIPVILCDEWSEAQVKAFRLLVNRSVTWADWDESLLSLELQELSAADFELSAADFDLSLTGFDTGEIDGLLAIPEEERANEVPPLPDDPVSRVGDLWLCGKHRVLCGDAIRAEDAARLLGDCKPILLVTDPPYGVELDSEWRDRAGLNGCGPAEASYMKHRTVGHTETTISGDTRADWSEAFELVPAFRSLMCGTPRSLRARSSMVSCASASSTISKSSGIRVAPSSPGPCTGFQHEPCWFVRKKNAPWYGKAGENSTIWASPSPKFIMGGSDEEKYDHPTQKPVDLMRRPILNHTKRGELVYEPFLGSGTTLTAAELTERVCLGIELDPKYVDVIIQRWQKLSGKKANLDGDGRTFEQLAEDRRKAAV